MSGETNVLEYIYISVLTFTNVGGRNVFSTLLIDGCLEFPQFLPGILTIF
jgi:hypothetical protein